MAKEISEHIFEIRYKPNPKVLDSRGIWAEMISEHMKLSEWRILGNRIDIYDKLNKNHAFVGFRNSGFLCIDSPTNNYFPDLAIKLLNFITKLDGFEKQPFVERIGVRSRFCNGANQSFEDLKNQYSSKYFYLTKDAEKGINAKLIDIGGNLNFADSLGNFNTASGPMEKNQILEFFNNRKEAEVPEVGLYYDIDYFIKPNKVMSVDEINLIIRKFTESSYDRYNKTKELILTA